MKKQFIFISITIVILSLLFCTAILISCDTPYEVATGQKSMQEYEDERIKKQKDFLVPKIKGVKISHLDGTPIEAGTQLFANTEYIIKADFDGTYETVDFEVSGGSFKKDSPYSGIWTTPETGGSYSINIVITSDYGNDEYVHNQYVEEVESVVAHLQPIVIESGSIEKDYGVYADGHPFIGISGFGEPMSGFVSFGIPEELWNATINTVILNLTFKNQSYLDELSGNNEFSIGFIGPFETNNYSIYPSESGSIGYVPQETGEMQYTTPCTVLSLPCDELTETMEIEFSGECISALQECVNTSSCDRAVFTMSCSNPPLGPADEAYGCHLEASLSVDYTPQETAPSEAAQTETEATEGVGLGLTQQDSQSDIVVEVVVENSPAYIAGFKPGYIIYVVDGHWLYDHNWNILFDVDTVADMIRISETGSVAITYTDSDGDVIFVARCAPLVRF